MELSDFYEQLKLVGARVAFYRKLKGYNQLELAEMCDLSETYVCRIENAKAKGLTLECCIKLAKALDVDIEKLIIGKGGI